MLSALGWMQDLEKRVQDMDCQMQSSIEGSEGILSRKIYKIEVVGNRISGSLRPSQSVISSQLRLL